MFFFHATFTHSTIEIMKNGTNTNNTKYNIKICAPPPHTIPFHQRKAVNTPSCTAAYI